MFHDCSTRNVLVSAIITEFSYKTLIYVAILYRVDGFPPARRIAPKVGVDALLHTSRILIHTPRTPAMPTNRRVLDLMLDEVHASLPKMIADHPDDGDLSRSWSEFAGCADAIEDSASAADYDHVRVRLDELLAARGLLP